MHTVNGSYGRDLRLWLPLHDDPADVRTVEPGRWLDGQVITAHYISWNTVDWWMDQQVPGYNLSWRELNRTCWDEVYRRHPELFINRSVPVQRFLWWRMNIVDSEAWEEYRDRR